MSAQPERAAPAQRSHLGLCFSTSVGLVVSCGLHLFGQSKALIMLKSMENRFLGLRLPSYPSKQEFFLRVGLGLASPGWMLPCSCVSIDSRGWSSAFVPCEGSHSGQSDVFVNYHRGEMVSKTLQRWRGWRSCWGHVARGDSAKHVPCLPQSPCAWVNASFPWCIGHHTSGLGTPRLTHPF